MEAIAAAPSGEAHGAAAPKKRSLENGRSDGDASSVPQASASEPGQKRRKTSSGSERSKKARASKSSDPPANDEAYEPSLGGSVGSDAAASEGQDLSNAEPGGSASRRVTRSQSQSAASNTGTTSNGPSTTDTNGEKKKKKEKKEKKEAKKTKKQKKDEAVNLAKNLGLPSDPSILQGPSGDDGWRLRFTAFRRELQKINPELVLNSTVLGEKIRRYLKEFAWRHQPKRQQNLHEAKKALLKIELGDGLDTIIAGGDEDIEADQQAGAGKVDVAWVYPSDPLLLDPDYPGEAFEDSLKRLCQAIVDGDAVGASRFTRPWLGKMVNRWISRKGWVNAGASRSKKIEEASRSIQALEQSGKLAEIFLSVLGPKADTADDVERPDSDGESIAEEPSQAEEEAVPDTQGSAGTQPGTEASALPPSASDWAALLGSDAASGEAGAEDHSDAKSVDTPIEQDAARGRMFMGEEDSSAEKARYFPSLDASAAFCVVCASDGHTAASCTHAICRHCDGEHFTWECPDRRRCKKCKQLGHDAATCKEKLAMTADEGVECAFCGSASHVDEECQILWRSYDVIATGAQKKVRHIPAFCSSCGIEGHYFSDCTLRGDWGPSTTWSLANRSQFIDPASEREAISALPSPDEAPTGMGHLIKGAALKNTHVFFSDSDGSEEGEFIGKKVVPKASAGPIRMSTNIQFTSISDPPPPPPPFHGQPPLPPGPPPPGPPPTGPSSKPGGYSRLAQPPQGRNPLPPRPRGGMHHQGNAPPPRAPLGPSNDRNRVSKPNGGPSQRGRGRGRPPKRGRGGRQG